jgi:hypothetical protein
MIWKYLNQKYPSEGNKWKIILPVSVFISFFLLIFQPFGLNGLEMDYKPLVLSGYGLVTFIILILNMVILPLLFPVAFSDEKWIVLKEMLFLMWILFTVGLANFLYSSWTIGFHLTLKNVLTFQVFTVAIGLIPITTIILVKQNYLRRKNEESAGEISETLEARKPVVPAIQLLRISSENEKDSVELSISDLLFIKSEGNYITVGYLRDGKVMKALLRNTLKYAGERLAPNPSIYQCHRSWLVNLDRISRVTGNSQGLRVEIQGMEEDIPVARNQIAEFKEKITENRS